MPSKPCASAALLLDKCKGTVGQGPASYRRPGGRLQKCANVGAKLNACKGAPVAGKTAKGKTDRLLKMYGGHSVSYLNDYLNTIKDGLSRQGRSKLDKLKLIQQHKKLGGLPKKR